MVELEDFKYGGTNITAFRLVDPNDELVQVVMTATTLKMLYFENTENTGVMFYTFSPMMS